MVNHPPATQAMWQTWVESLGQGDPLEKGMAAHSSALAGKRCGQRSLVGYSPCTELTHARGQSAGEQVARTYSEPAFS